MRIVLAGQTYYPGNNGQAIFTIHLAEGLACAGHNVHMLAPWPHFRYQAETHNGVCLHLVRSVNFGWIHPEAYYSFFPAAQIRRIFRAVRPDVVHIQDHYFLCRDVVSVARQLHIPVMGTNHFLPENLLPYLHLLPLTRKQKIALLWALMLQTYNRLDIVTTPTQTAAGILGKQAIRPAIRPVSCGVNTCQFQPSHGINRAAACAKFGLDPTKTIFLYVGRLDGEKRIDLLLRGLALLRDAGRGDVQYAIAGQGAGRADLLHLAHTLNLEDHVRFLGYVPNADLPLLYQTAHIFAMPSPEELQSIASLEAMASGLPILAANARALVELVTQGENGYLFAPNSAAALAEGMTYLLDHRAQWSQMGAASRARAETHSIENTIHQYTALYQEIQHNTPKGA